MTVTVVMDCAQEGQIAGGCTSRLTRLERAEGIAGEGVGWGQERVDRAVNASREEPPAGELAGRKR
jgi:hypothetical protein